MIRLVGRLLMISGKNSKKNFSAILTWKKNFKFFKSSAANAFHWQGVILGLCVFFSMIKAIKIWDGEKYLEVMKGTYFRAGGDFKQHLLLMLCTFCAFVQG